MCIAVREYIFKPQKKRREFLNTIKSKHGLVPAEVVEKPLSSLQNIKEESVGAELLFFAIGQRGLFSWFHTIRKIYNQCGYNDLLQISEEYCKDLNLLIKKRFFWRRLTVEVDASGEPLQVWQRICLRGEKVAAGNASSDRIGALLTLAVAGMRLDAGDKVEETATYLRSPFGKIRSEYIKEWEERLEMVEETETLDSDLIEDSIDEESEEYQAPSVVEQLSSDSADKLAQESIYTIVKLARDWKKEV